ncbi:hypothetical protein DSO57_1028692 [Entomophthora muscae]|uniref:Uncharacterized protein n=1 Tax=Entomophthora muscae TaxID=34485 RepID=A0ACC2SEA7_9FUNG|nr:hypothetical protein DSO57_1028692 [Entomophthora muscae]
MFGAFKATSICLSGLLNKVPWRMSASRKANVRKRLKQVDSVVDALTESGLTCKRLEAFKKLPKEDEMTPREKYTVFCASAKGHRKAIHKVPKFTKIPHPRISPPGF